MKPMPPCTCTPSDGHLQAHLGAEALDQRHHEFVEQACCLRTSGIRVMVRRVIGRGRNSRQRAAALGAGAHGHEHAACTSG
jgi:hypothetical protein